MQDRNTCQKTGKLNTSGNIPALSPAYDSKPLSSEAQLMPVAHSLWNAGRRQISIQSSTHPCVGRMTGSVELVAKLTLAYFAPFGRCSNRMRRCSWRTQESSGNTHYGCLSNNMLGVLNTKDADKFIISFECAHRTLRWPCCRMNQSFINV